MIGKQSGAVLAVGLVFLLLLTILGMTAMQVTTMQERMAGNSRDKNLAFQAAEFGLRDGEAFLLGKDFYDFNSSCTGAKCAQGSAPNWKTYAWAGATDVSASSSFDGVSETPRYFTEYVGQVKCPDCSGGWRSAYGITTRAKGGSTNSVVFLNETYRP
jgi:type IV pilus assembly protein PilX